MSKKIYTVMIMNEGDCSSPKVMRVTKKPLYLAILFTSLVIIALVASILLAIHFYQAPQAAPVRIIMQNDSEAQNRLHAYIQQLDELNIKLNTITELEYKVRDLVAYQEGAQPSRQIAVGGKEVDILKDYFSFSDRKEQEFFDSLNETLSVMRSEIAKRESSLSKLVDYLEEQRFVMLSTPTIWPTQGWLSSRFGFRTSPFTGRQVFHEGVDIAARYGANVRSTAKGVVVFAGDKSGYGKVVTIDHGYGFMTRYGHNSSLTVKVGDKVNKGDVIAKVGSTGRSTGPHVHYEILINGIPVNPLKYVFDSDEVAILK